MARHFLTQLPAGGGLWCNCQRRRFFRRNNRLPFIGAAPVNSLQTFTGWRRRTAWGCSSKAQQAEGWWRELPTVLHLFWSYGSFGKPIMMPLAWLRFVYSQQELGENEQKQSLKAPAEGHALANVHISPILLVLKQRPYCIRYMPCSPQHNGCLCFA